MTDLPGRGSFPAPGATSVDEGAVMVRGDDRHRTEAVRPWAVGRLVVALVLVLGVLAGCESRVTPVVGCEAGAGLDPVCAFCNPEDLAPFAPTGHLLVSEYGGMDGARPGRLSAWRPGDARPRALFPRTDAASVVPAGPVWGAADCPGPPDARFSPHGIDLERRADGRWALLAVNHGGRESVEFFEVTVAGGRPSLQWRGCVVAPGDELFNDVVTLRGGGFWVSHMYPRSAELASTVKAILGTDVGHVLHWDPATGFRTLPGTETRVPNGIEKSPDERSLYLAEYVGGRVLLVDVESGERLAAAPVPGPDNLAWDTDGRLLVASHDDDLSEFLACDGLESGACGFRFRILSLDPESLVPTAEPVVEGRGAPMGGATVAVRLGDALWLGSFAGDRIARVVER
jgi:hypothetical protein